MESLNPERVDRTYRKASEPRYACSERREQLRRNLEAEGARIIEFERKRQSLLERYSEMSDEDFDREYQEASAELEDILAKVTRYFDEYREHRPYTVEFVDLNQIKSLGEFLEASPMLFVPRKEEIGRILALAKRMHEDRIKRGEKNTAEPIRIVDIGGANGAIGKLVTDLANENNLNIEYTIVDPDSPTVQRSAHFYKDSPNLQFRVQGGEDFNIEQYRDNPEISNLLAERNLIVIEGKRKQAYLQKVVTAIESQRETLTPNAIKRYIRKRYIQILQVDFAINLQEALADDEERFLKKFEDQQVEETLRTRSFVDVYMDSWRKRVNDVTEQVESLISQQPARYDLVINSWMPLHRFDKRSQRG